MSKILTKTRENMKIYQQDIYGKGIYWSIIDRLYKIPPFKKILTPLVNNLKPDFVVINNLKIYIDKEDQIVSHGIVTWRSWEKFESELFEKTIKRGDIVLDIGAHIGYYTLIAAKKVGPSGKVFAFEPNERNFGLLKKNVETNNLTNVVLFKNAVSEKKGILKLFISSSNSGDHRIYSNNEARDEIEVTTLSLDDVFKKINKSVDVIKMDIQGAELKALRGAALLLKSSSSLKIFTEFWPRGFFEAGDNPKDYLNLLDQYGFIFYNINSSEEKIEKTTISDILKYHPKDYNLNLDLLCIKESSGMTN